MSAPTPAPWINDGAEISARVDPEHPTYIAPVCSVDTDWHPEIVAANARLIAAAPDLLHALQMIDSNAAESVEWIRRVARQAIARAIGNSFNP